MPTVFASTAVTVLMLYAITTVSMLIPGLVPGMTPGVHMIVGIAMALLTVFLQTMVFGFLIGSGKSVKKVVAEEGLDASFIEKTKEHKNRCYPAIMMAITAMVVAAAAGGGVGVGKLSPTIHLGLVLISFGVNAYAFFISWRVVSDDVAMMHEVNRRVDARPERKAMPSPVEIPADEAAPGPSVSRGGQWAYLGLTIAAVGVYFRWVLGNPHVPGGTLAIVGTGLFIAGWILSRRARRG